MHPRIVRPRSGPIGPSALTPGARLRNVLNRRAPLPSSRLPLARTDSDVTRLLAALASGEPDAMDQQLPVIYDELKRLAASQLRRERNEHTLGATALVHEAFLRLVDQRAVDWRGRSHFFGIAAQAMRRILVDHARRQHEIFHLLGVVSTAAPNHALAGHVGNDPTDLMYAGPLVWRPSTVDVTKTNYYNPTGLPGTVSNFANSPYVVAAP